MSGSWTPLRAAYPRLSLHAASCQLAFGPDKMHGTLSQETGMAWSPSSLLAVSSEDQTCIDYFFLSLPVSRGNLGVPLTVYYYSSAFPCFLPLSLNKAEPSLSKKCAVAPGASVPTCARACMGVRTYTQI